MSIRVLPRLRYLKNNWEVPLFIRVVENYKARFIN